MKVNGELLPNPKPLTFLSQFSFSKSLFLSLFQLIGCCFTAQIFPGLALLQKIAALLNFLRPNLLLTSFSLHTYPDNILLGPL